MVQNNIEIKARHNDVSYVRGVLNQNNAKFIGEDHQTDTYFKVPKGRLKVRRGNIENYLIYYERNDIKEPKKSKVFLAEIGPDPGLETILEKILGVLVVVEKRREIYFIDNVKFHIDFVSRLGEFVEIEAIDKYGTIGLDRLREQRDKYMELLRIRAENLIDKSYSDMLLENNK